MRVILDSNILLSAIISPFGPPYLIVQAWGRGDFRLVTCDHQIAEVKRVSRYAKFRGDFSPAQIGELINDMKLAIHPSPIPRRHTCTDPDDAYLLDLADISAADFLITGDQRAGLLSRKRVARASILSAKAFAAALNL